jgi:acyl-CoA reductase-like NAD-dependent aldehyde dehydrogenase
MNAPALFIDGEARAAAATFPVLDPATQELVDHAPECGREQLDAAVAAAARAQADWAADEPARQAALHVASERLDAAAAELGRLLTAEQGKPLRNAESEVRGSAAWLRACADLTLPDELLDGGAGAQVTLRYRPHGVVAAITPWNFPLLLTCWKLGPALLAGNTVVAKPSPYTPLATLRMGELLADAFPAGVLNVVSGGDELGAALVAHPLVRKVSFTGSVGGGRKVAAAAAVDLKRVTLELGGNDAAIVLEDADPAKIAEAVFWAAFDNCGQVCAAIKRLYVPRRLAGTLTDALVARAEEVVVGPGTQPGVELGPIATRPQFERVAGLVADALRDGAVAVAGGAPFAGPGNFFAPTLLTAAPEDSRIVAEEQFGPVLPILVYDDLDDALARANGTRFGLCGSVWGEDLDAARRVADQLDCGSAYVNSHGSVSPTLPFGGVKDSGIGVENGHWGLHEYADLRVSHVACG